MRMYKVGSCHRYKWSEVISSVWFASHQRLEQQWNRIGHSTGQERAGIHSFFAAKWWSKVQTKGLSIMLDGANKNHVCSPRKVRNLFLDYFSNHPHSTHIMQGSLNYLFWRRSNTANVWVCLRNLPLVYSAFFGLVSYNDPCNPPKKQHTPTGRYFLSLFFN